MQGWQGVLTIPRVVEFDAASRTLLLNPIPELTKLQGRKLFDGRLDLANAKSFDKASSSLHQTQITQLNLVGDVEAVQCKLNLEH